MMPESDNLAFIIWLSITILVFIFTYGAVRSGVVPNLIGESDKNTYEPCEAKTPVRRIKNLLGGVLFFLFLSGIAYFCILLIIDGIERALLPITSFGESMLIFVAALPFCLIIMAYSFISAFECLAEALLSYKNYYTKSAECIRSDND